MLSPKKVKHRKQMKGRLTGVSTKGSSICYGEFALKAIQVGQITSQQIESARITISRTVKRSGKMWIRIFPDKPITRKPAETRMGSGKGNPELWVAQVKPGRIIYEISSIDENIAKEALTTAGNKLPFATKIISKRETL